MGREMWRRESEAQHGLGKFHAGSEITTSVLGQLKAVECISQSRQPESFVATPSSSRVGMVAMNRHLLGMSTLVMGLGKQGRSPNHLCFMLHLQNIWAQVTFKEKECISHDNGDKEIYFKRLVSNEGFQATWQPWASSGDRKGVWEGGRILSLLAESWILSSPGSPASEAQLTLNPPKGPASKYWQHRRVGGYIFNMWTFRGHIQTTTPSYNSRYNVSFLLEVARVCVNPSVRVSASYGQESKSTLQPTSAWPGS